MRRTRKKNIREQHDPRGIYSQVVNAPHTDEESEIETTLGDDIPINPGQQMATQLSTERPPIEDDEFTPVSSVELARSAAAIAEEVPNSQVAWYYKQLHKLLDDAIDRSVAPEEEGEVKEESIRKAVRTALFNILKEQAGVDYFGDDSEFDEYRYGKTSPVRSKDIEPIIPDVTNSGEMGLEDLAAEYGYAGASGIRQEINRLTDRMEYFATTISHEDLDALTDYAAGEYIDALEVSKLLDPEDIKDLRLAPLAVKGLDSFRFFFVSAFVLPAYKEVAKEARDKVMTEIEGLGIPKEIHQTVYNQISGATKRKPELIQKKLSQLVDKEKIKPEEVKEIQDKIRSAAPVLIAMGNLSDDLVERALNRWQAMSNGRRKSILKKTMEQTAGFQEQGK